MAASPMRAGCSPVIQQASCWSWPLVFVPVSRVVSCMCRMAFRMWFRSASGRYLLLGPGGFHAPVHLVGAGYLPGKDPLVWGELGLHLKFHSDHRVGVPVPGSPEGRSRGGPGVAAQLGDCPQDG